MRKPLPDWGVVFVVLTLEVGEVLNGLRNAHVLPEKNYIKKPTP